MPEKVTKFTGVPSGDHEAFCFDVTQADFDRLPRPGYGTLDRADCASPFYRSLFQVYPDPLLPEFDENTLYDIEVTVRMTPVGKAQKIEE